MWAALVAINQPAQDDTTYRFALRKMYFYDAWRLEPILDTQGSDLVLPRREGLLTQGCYPRRNLQPLNNTGGDAMCAEVAQVILY